ncbi:sulfate adenylyltransferase subunit 1 [Melioribacter sp. OK-6-Me]|uniref:sulfate adenylyltransferase subunit 1 n=1 Tax=unclassified Melioribacter TaxID=2627329 RepID=UPI003ED9EBCA
MKERMNIVFVGHVDHGKSTLIGRLLSDTNSLPEGKLEQVKRTCQLNSKPFEYAFLLDALKDEQAQGITIDTARVFFKTSKREYIIIDAPGHIEFLKNMVSGASRADAAILTIDAQEGIAENSRRHAYMLSMLGINQIVVAVNKMDLVNYSRDVFENIKTNYSIFLTEIGITPVAYVPVSAREGINLIAHSDRTPWYRGKTIIDLIDDFKCSRSDPENSFRMFVQGVYKFTEKNDNRRIIAGTINSGRIERGDEIIFLPSGKTSNVKSIEIFGKEDVNSAEAGMAIGLTITSELYIKNGELICKKGEKLPSVSNRFKANIFWMGKNKLTIGKKYKIKLGTFKSELFIEKIETSLDASTLRINTNPENVNRHEVATVILNTLKPVAFDLSNEIKDTGRFVIVEDYDIAGGGIITESLPTSDIHLQPDYTQFEIELYNLIKKYFPHWEINIIKNQNERGIHV